MNTTSPISIPEHVMSRVVGDELAILDLESGIYFGLDTVGARVWQLIESGKSVSEICATMASEYDVSREILDEDVKSLIGQLLESKLIGLP